MKRAAYLAGLLVIAILMGGCATTSMPSHAEVTDEAKASLQEIVDLMPTGAVATSRPDQAPDSCDISMIGGKRDGFFYTGSVDIVLPTGTDVSSVVNELPSRLGDGWQNIRVDLKLSFPTVELRNTRTEVQVNVMGSKPEEATPSIYLNAISRCGERPAG
ncbi:hypothetical protein [uncultured Microbacterium sp.]|uniref:hypothetical protein n=1 Tax=uncultured Microbacterium sp. TaxID=191216 RepID=UPI0025E693A8|nr:hypothetical protein [uncultured Microbacterium sp.]